MSDWIPTSDEVPPLNLPVWLFEPGRGIWVGERFDFGGGDNWAWANTYGSQRFQADGTWYAPSNEIDLDYHPTHWMRLPEPPPAAQAHAVVVIGPAGANPTAGGLFPLNGGYICPDCCQWFEAEPTECVHGDQRCTGILTRAKPAA